MRGGNLTAHRSCALFLTLAVIFFLGLALTPECLASTAPAQRSLLDSGYLDMYDLRFSAAHRAFDEWTRQHPSDPLGPASAAAAYLFSEFNRLGVLRAQFFVSNKGFEQRPNIKPDPAVKRAFDDKVAKSLKLADSILVHDPRNKRALFSKVLDLGLRADYLALIQKREVASLSTVKRAGILADQLVKIDPSCYDAYLAVGVENYLLSLNSAPVRWALQLDGLQTNRAHGIKQLRLTAEKGHYLLPYARLLLAIAALRENDRAEAERLLEWLTQHFPDNPLYSRELARVEKRNGRGSE